MKKKFQILDSFHLKIIAMILMVIDHIGLFFIPYSSPLYLIFRIIGRLSFPMFCFFVVESMRYSKNKIRYMIQLLIMSILINLGSIIFLKEYSGSVFDSFFLGALTIYLLSNKNILVKITSIFPFIIAMLSGFDFFPIRLEYGPYGYLIILLFYLSYHITLFGSKLICDQYDLNYDYYKDSYDFTFVYMATSCAIYFIYSTIVVLLNYELQILLTANDADFSLQGYSVLCFVFLMLYTGKKGYSNKIFKYSCYLFYPLHLILFYLISLLIN